MKTFDNPLDEAPKSPIANLSASGKFGNTISASNTKKKVLQDEAGAAQSASFENESDSFDQVGAAAFERDDGKAQQRQAEFEHELTDDELSDLTYAFQACDVDGFGTIEPDELYAMMVSLGAEVDLHTVKLVMKEATGKFRVWIDEQIAKEGESVELPSELQHTADEAGHHGSTKHGAKRHHAEIGIQKKHVLVRIGLHPALAPVRVPMKYSAKVVYISGKVVASPVTILAKRKHEDPYKGMTEEEKGKAIEEALLSDQHMTFGEFMYMMCHREVVEKLVPGDWHQSADKMRKYRHAFGKCSSRCPRSAFRSCWHMPFSLY